MDTLAKDSGHGGAALADYCSFSNISTLMKTASKMTSKTMIVI